MKAVVTGGTGFIGRSVVDELLNNNIDVICLVRNENKIPQQWKGKVIVKNCSLEEMSNIKPEEISEDKVDLFFHFAWKGTAGVERKDYKIQNKNAEYTCDAVELAHRLGCSRFINAGSIMEYEEIKLMGDSELTPDAASIYRAAKLSSHYMSKTLAFDLGMAYCNVIISNAYGAGEKSARFLNTVVRNMMADKEIAMTEGTQQYDFIYITDVARAIVLAGIKGNSNTDYYIGNINQRRLKDFVINAKEILGSSSELLFGQVPFKPIKLSYKEFDTAKIYNELGFKADISFREGILKLKKQIEKEENENE